MKNPLAVAFGMIIKALTTEKLKDNNFRSKQETNDFIAKSFGISSQSLKGLYVGSYYPSDEIIMGIIGSDVIDVSSSQLLQFCCAYRAIPKSGTFDEIRDKIEAVSRAVNHERLSLILKKSLSIQECDVSSMKYEIVDSGLYQSLTEFISGNDVCLSPTKRTQYYAEFAREEDLSYIYDTYVELIGASNTPPFDFFTSRYDRNNRIATIIYRDQTKEEKVGYFIMYPITEDCSMKLLAAKMPSQGIQPSDVMESFEECAGIWMGMTTGVNSYASGMVISEMIEHIKPLLSLPNVKYLFSRWGSRQGESLIKRFGFEQIKGSNSCVLPVSEEKLQELGIERILNYR